MTSPLLNDDPLAPLLLPPAKGPAVPLRYRSGRLLAWDIKTGESTVLIDGVEFSNLPILVGSYLGVMNVGDVISLLSTTDETGVSTYAIHGLSLRPPDARVPLASSVPGYSISEWPTNTLGSPSHTTSGTFVDFATVDQTVFYKTAQTSLVELRQEGTVYVATTDGAGVAFGVQVDLVTDYVVLEINGTNGLFNKHTPWSRTITIPGLDAGQHVFQPRWRRISGAGVPTVDGGDSFTMTIREVLA